MRERERPEKALMRSSHSWMAREIDIFRSVETRDGISSFRKSTFIPPSKGHFRHVKRSTCGSDEYACKLKSCNFHSRQ